MNAMPCATSKMTRIVSCMRRSMRVLRHSVNPKEKSLSETMTRPAVRLAARCERCVRVGKVISAASSMVRPTVGVMKKVYKKRIAEMK